MKSKILHKIRRRKDKKSDKPLPKVITSENIADHREEILGSGRKYIYPLKHSKHRLVKISLTLFLVAVITFFSYCVVALYKVKTTSKFLHQVTRVVPLPLARIGSDFVSYESYLFEVNRYKHYYETQQGLDFKSKDGKAQLAEYKKRALNKVINDAYIKILAQQKGISVSDQEVNDQISIIRSQNRLGSTNKEFESVLRDFWDWSIDDFKRSLKQQLLAEKVVAALDTEAKAKAEKAQSEIGSGKDFAKVANEFSEDPSTKNSGGEFSFLVDKSNRDISPKTVEALFKLKPGEVSPIVNVGYGLEIIKNIEQKDDKIKAAHIIINFKDINQYLSSIKDQKKTRSYISF